MKIRATHIFIFMIAIMILLSGCTGTTSTPTTPNAQTPAKVSTPTAPAQAPAKAAAPVQVKTIKLAGSKTASVVLNEIANLYTKNHPEVKFEFTISETGLGVYAMINGSADIAMGSRALKPVEADDAKKAGINAFKTTIFYDLNQFYVSKSNPINDISSEQIKRIYFQNAGTPITDWSEVTNGAYKGKISIWGGDDALGSAGLVRDVIFKGANFSKDIHRSEFTYYNVLKAESVNDPMVLGYTSQYYVSDDYLTLNKIPAGTYKSISIDGSAATIENVKSGKYKVVKEVYILTNGEPNKEVRDFLNFVMSTDGTKIVLKQGFTPLNN